ncbi:MAG: redoxin family protein [Beijerinckiaceae bacterium]
MEGTSAFMINRRALLDASRLAVLGGAALTLTGCQALERDPLPDMVSLAPVPGLKTPMGSPLPGLTGRVFRDRAVVLNVWASWCPYCRSEHDTLMRLGRNGTIPVLGIVYRDQPEAAAHYLRSAGNPYRALGQDQQNWVRSHLRQSGVPATHIVAPNGRVIATFPGALNHDRVESELRPAYERAKTIS